MRFLAGLVVGAVASVALKSSLRPLLRGAVKGTIVLGRKIQEMQAEVAEDLMDLRAEAEAELKEPVTVHTTTHTVHSTA